jgi:hypothetical protein
MEFDLPKRPLEATFDPEVPHDTVYMIAERKPGETLAAWLRRCGVIRNIGKAPDAVDTGEQVD